MDWLSSGSVPPISEEISMRGLSGTGFCEKSGDVYKNEISNKRKCIVRMIFWFVYELFQYVILLLITVAHRPVKRKYVWYNRQWRIRFECVAT